MTTNLYNGRRVAESPIKFTYRVIRPTNCAQRVMRLCNEASLALRFAKYISLFIDARTAIQRLSWIFRAKARWRHFGSRTVLTARTESNYTRHNFYSSKPGTIQNIIILWIWIIIFYVFSLLYICIINKIAQFKNSH